MDINPKEFQNKEKVFSNLISKIKTLELTDEQKGILNPCLKNIKDDFFYLTEENLLEINSWCKKETDSIKRDIQSNIRLYKRSNNRDIKMFLIHYLKSRNPDAVLGKEEYTDLG